MTFPFGGNTYTDWDFANSWDSGTAAYENNGYPFHQWQTTRLTLQFSSGLGGTITGDVTQTRIPGTNGTPVTAAPNSGFEFLGWSDGVATATGTDRNVTESFSVTAQFTPVTYTVQQAVDTMLGLSSVVADCNMDGIVDAADAMP